VPSRRKLKAPLPACRKKSPAKSKGLNGAEFTASGWPGWAVTPDSCTKIHLFPYSFKPSRPSFWRSRYAIDRRAGFQCRGSRQSWRGSSIRGRETALANGAVIENPAKFPRNDTFRRTVGLYCYSRGLYILILFHKVPEEIATASFIVGDQNLHARRRPQRQRNRGENGRNWFLAPQFRCQQSGGVGPGHLKVAATLHEICLVRS